MAGLSYIQFIDKVKALTLGYVLVKKFVAEFEYEIQNKLTVTEEYYAVAVCPAETPVTFLGDTSEMRMKVFCYGLIQADRSNVLNLCSDAALILQDLYNDLKEGDDFSVEVVNDCDIEFEDNSRIDYLAGASMTITISAAAATQCEIARKADYEA